MTTFTEPVRPGEFILTDEASMSYDQITIASGAGVLVPGTVLGKITASGKYVAHDNTTPATDGSQTAACVLFGDVDATSADVAATGVTRLAEIKGDLLTWKAGISAEDKAAGIAELATHHLIVR